VDSSTEDATNPNQEKHKHLEGLQGTTSGSNKNKWQKVIAAADAIDLLLLLLFPACWKLGCFYPIMYTSD